MMRAIRWATTAGSMLAAAGSWALWQRERRELMTALVRVSAELAAERRRADEAEQGLDESEVQRLDTEQALKEAELSRENLRGTCARIAEALTMATDARDAAIVKHENSARVLAVTLRQLDGMRAELREMWAPTKCALTPERRDELGREMHEAFWKAWPEHKSRYGDTSDEAREDWRRAAEALWRRGLAAAAPVIVAAQALAKARTAAGGTLAVPACLVYPLRYLTDAVAGVEDMSLDPLPISPYTSTAQERQDSLPPSWPSLRAMAEAERLLAERITGRYRTEPGDLARVGRSAHRLAEAYSRLSIAPSTRSRQRGRYSRLSTGCWPTQTATMEAMLL